MSKKFCEHEYKGVKVWYNEHSEKWECLLNEDSPRISETQNLADLRKRIDAHVKREKNFKRFEVIELSQSWRRHGEHYQVLTVTSITANGEYWCVDAKGSRTKERPKGLARNTPENQEIVRKAKETDANAEVLKKQVRALRESIQIERDEPEEDDE